MGSLVNATELNEGVAEDFWNNLREQKISAFGNLGADQTLYRLALPAACGPIAISKPLLILMVVMQLALDRAQT